MSESPTDAGATIRLLALMEATTVTGPAKLLIEFCGRARALADSEPGAPRVEASIVTFQRGDPAAPNRFVEAARAAGVEVDVVSERFRFDPGVVAQLRRVFARRAPDIVETHMIKSHFLVRLAGLAPRRPWVAFHHGYTTTDMKMRLYNRINRLTLPSATRVATVCGAFARQLERAGVKPERIFVRHSSVAAAARAGDDEALGLRALLGVAEGERVILSVGRLSREKGHADLLRALSHLAEIDPALKFKAVVVGDGPERAGLEAEAASLGLKERVVFAGHADDVRPFYAAADVSALPSHSEGSPLALLEAMAAGLPVVATAVGGVPEVAADGETALLVPARDPRAFAAALSRVLSDDALARTLAANASARVASDFSPEARARSLVEFYSGLVPEKAGGRPPNE
ncbi:MAG: glycosyltransferase [Acidobacteria bacterium]|nr:glycosyltransferase [Acidobacteriota bacterium]